ncbi:MAG: type II toxin-antitoxin system VapC family toxin [Phycisphaerae bacterium]|nr:type II toxin-antitoxin system VapC family toxin [Phycisphaerae bacterium]
MKPMRIYVDTSVFGGFFDEGFSSASRRFFEMVRHRRVKVMVSDLLLDEIAEAPEPVRELVRSIMEHGCIRVGATEEAARLQDWYLAAGVVSPRYADDAMHVALATLQGADAIVSWNFKHLVNPTRVRGFNQVNIQRGYGTTVILSPEELLHVLESEDAKDGR